MQGVFTKFLQLWIPNKTDKGSVVTDVFEPNFAKLDQNAESANQTLENLKNDKLDRGTYPGTADDLKTEIDGKVSKDGDTVSGNLIMRGSDPVEIDTTFLNEPWARGIFYKKNGIITGGIGAIGKPELDKLYIGTGNLPYENSELIISKDDVVFRSKRLITNSQEGITAINENNRNITGAIGKYDGYFPLTNAIKNNVYFLESLNKSYICLKNYTGTSLSVPNHNFEELSIYTNRIKFQNIGAYDSSLVSTFPEFNTGLGIPLVAGNTISFTIGTNEALPTKNKYLGTALLKPRTPVSAAATCVIPGTGVVGVVVVQINTSGAIEIAENIGVDPLYINTKSAYYATFNYVYIKED